MAGGPHAAVVPCFTCGARSERTVEGFESDQYVCEKGHAFGIDWRDKPATEPQWPPSPQLAALLAKRRQK
jgi:hypothetical protein